MGVDATLEDEVGNRLRVVLDSSGLFAGLLQRASGPSFLLLRFIDPYQDTTFNQRQVTLLKEELRQLRQSTADRDAADHIALIEELAEAVEREPHRYLKFRGD